jgi:hypothetical protein
MMLCFVLRASAPSGSAMKTRCKLRLRCEGDKKFPRAFSVTGARYAQGRWRVLVARPQRVSIDAAD